MSYASCIDGRRRQAKASVMMNLRICDGGHEQTVSATPDLVERIFAAEAPIADGAEIAVSDGARWLAVLALCAPDGSEEFLLSGELGGAEAVSGRTDRAGALQRFRKFMRPIEGD